MSLQRRAELRQEILDITWRLGFATAIVVLLKLPHEKVSGRAAVKTHYLPECQTEKDTGSITVPVRSALILLGFDCSGTEN